MSSEMTCGACKLTGEEGAFVKAHIIPDALTRPEKGAPFAQAGLEAAPIARWTSWYDKGIVTAAGEKILAGYDDWAIQTLRDHRLVWSGWGDEMRLIAPDWTELEVGSGFGVRKIEGIDGARLRLFFLSLLWRAAVSRLPEFEAVNVRSRDIRRLGRMLRDEDPGRTDFFPVMLTQHATRGPLHNETPLAVRRPLHPDRANAPAVPLFRFYFDGLVACIHRRTSTSDIASLGPLIVGASETLAVTTVPFEGSRQEDSLVAVMSAAKGKWPERLDRIAGKARVAAPKAAPD